MVRVWLIRDKNVIFTACLQLAVKIVVVEEEVKKVAVAVRKPLSLLVGAKYRHYCVEMNTERSM